MVCNGLDFAGTWESSGVCENLEADIDAKIH